MTHHVLKAERRTSKGKEAAHKLRAKGFVLGVIYGSSMVEHLQAGEESIGIFLPLHETELFLKRRTSELFYLSLDDSEIPVILKTVQRDPVTKKILHIDFYNVDLKKPIEYKVPIRCIGTPAGVRNEGGILEHIMRHLDINCLPEDIPQYLDVDVTDLNIAQSIHVKDLSFDKITILDAPNRTVATVLATRKSTAAIAAKQVAEKK
ncbi:MAG: 50S ribosomal protein L25 [Candidatus Coatesbacteria bacterium]|nr:50S ribosomal protein L25 [Candidatus Coatesbacteria bacterium]